MKIGIICYNHFDATIPLGKYLGKIAPDIEAIDFIFLLSRTRLNVDIIELDGKIHENGFVDEAQLQQWIDPQVYNYIRPKGNVNVFILNSYKLFDLVNVGLLRTLKNEIKRRKYDVLHLVGNNRWVIFLNLMLTGMPKVHTLHEPYPFEQLSKYRLFRHESKIKLLIRSNSHIILPSQVSYRRFMAHFLPKAGKLSVIPFGPMEIFREYLGEAVNQFNNVILYYGNISEYKGINILIEAMKIVATVNPDLRLIIAGGGAFNYDISGLDGAIELINRHLSNQEIAAFNQRATLVVCPYISASQSGVVMTSFAFGRPILATNVGALPEFVEDGVCGKIIEPNNPTALAEAILTLFENPATLQQLSKNVENKYNNSKNSWLNLTKKHYELYRNEIKKSGYSKIESEEKTPVDDYSGSVRLPY